MSGTTDDTVGVQVILVFYSSDEDDKCCSVKKGPARAHVHWRVCISVHEREREREKSYMFGTHTSVYHVNTTYIKQYFKELYISLKFRELQVKQGVR